MLTSKANTKGTLHIVVRDAETGVVKHDVTEKNLIVNAGLAMLVSRLLGVATGVPSHMGIGTSATAAAAAQTDLVTPAVRTALTSSTIVTTTVANDTAQFVGTFPAGSGTGAITEAGIFNAVSAGTMLNRATFGVVNKGAGDEMVITWKVQLT